MEQSKRKISYSIIRYSPDVIKGEILNVGLLMYNYLDKKTKFYLLNEKSSKLRCIFENNVEANIYKSNKDFLEYYLEKSKEDLSGYTGDIFIASYYDESFMDKYYEYFKDKQMTLSKPIIAFTKNEEMLFDTILKRYIGESHLDFAKATTITAKRYMKNIIDNNENLKKRIKPDKIIQPIKDLNNIKVKIDFTFKNGVWNYMQAIPNVSNNRDVEWFSKIQLLLESEDIKNSKLHLLYKMSELNKDISTLSAIKYLSNKHDNIVALDMDQETKVNELCDYIESNGQILEDAV